MKNRTKPFRYAKTTADEIVIHAVVPGHVRAYYEQQAIDQERALGRVAGEVLTAHMRAAKKRRKK